MLNRSVVFSVLLAGVCTAGCSPVWKATYQTTRAAFLDTEQVVRQTPLNSRYRYLKVGMNGNSGLLALGVEEQHSDGKLEIWAAGNPVLLQLKDGRYWGSHGLPVNWHDVSQASFPRWNQVSGAVQYTRERRVDEVPPQVNRSVAAAFSVKETVQLEPLMSAPVVAARFQKELSLDTSADIHWFAERVVSSTAISLMELPAFYAVAQHPQPHVVWGYQCVSPTFCMTWQPWSASVAKK